MLFSTTETSLGGIIVKQTKTEERATHATSTGHDANMRKTTGTIGATAMDVEDAGNAASITDRTDSPNDESQVDAASALVFLDALDKDRDAAADRMDAGSRTPYTLLGGILAAANAALYWLIGWTLFGGHGKFTIVDVWICLIVGALLAAVLIGVLTHIERVTGIGVWNRRQFSPAPHGMRNERYRAAFIVYTAYNWVAVPGGMLLLGVFCAPWWPAAIAVPTCALVGAAVCHRFLDEYMRLIRAGSGDIAKSGNGGAA